jgi:hypothetical protein
MVVDPRSATKHSQRIAIGNTQAAAKPALNLSVRLAKQKESVWPHWKHSAASFGDRWYQLASIDPSR